MPSQAAAVLWDLVRWSPQAKRPACPAPVRPEGATECAAAQLSGMTSAKTTTAVQVGNWGPEAPRRGSGPHRARRDLEHRGRRDWADAAPGHSGFPRRSARRQLVESRAVANHLVWTRVAGGGGGQTATAACAPDVWASGFAYDGRPSPAPAPAPCGSARAGGECTVPSQEYSSHSGLSALERDEDPVLPPPPAGPPVAHPPLRHRRGLAHTRRHRTRRNDRHSDRWAGLGHRLGTKQGTARRATPSEVWPDIRHESFPFKLNEGQTQSLTTSVSRDTPPRFMP